MTICLICDEAGHTAGTILMAGALLLFAGAAHASEENRRACVGPRERDCWIDLNYEARIKMEERMQPCFEHGLDADCLFALGWRKPLYEDERFKPRWVFRGKR
jgi:hypothetical protein